MPVPSSSTGGTTADLSGFTSDAGQPYPPNTPFWLVHFGSEPGTWEAVDVDGTTYWLPSLTPWQLREGTNGVRTLSGGEPKSARVTVAEQMIRERGGVVVDLVSDVPADCLPPGVAAGGALRSWPCRGGGTHYALVWDQPRPKLGNGEFVPKHYRVEFNRWRLHLVVSGQISPPSDEILDATRATIAARADGVRTAASNEPIPDVREARIKAADSAVDAVTIARVATEPPKRGRSKAAEAGA